MLVHCNIVNNDYQQYSRLFYTFISDKPFGQLQHISPRGFIFSKTFNPEFSFFEGWFTDQNSKPQEIEDKVNISIDYSVKYEK